MDEPHVREWFHPDELDECPSCLEQGAFTTPEASVVVCVRCGFLGFEAGSRPAPVSDAFAGPRVRAAPQLGAENRGRDDDVPR